MQFTFEELDISGKNADRLARDIFIKIANDSYGEGSQLPSVREMANQTSMTDYSARKVMFSLANAGLVEVKSRKGMYVAFGAKQKAIKILKRHNQTFSAIDDGLRKRTIAVAAAFKNTIDGPQLYHPQTISGIYREAEVFGFAVELISFNVDIVNTDNFLRVVKDNSYDGIIWLYPELSHWDSINALRDHDIPVVVSSHWLFNTSLPCVQVNSYASAVSVTEHLVNTENCDVVNWFSTESYSPQQVDNSDYAKIAASGTNQTLKLAMEMVCSDRSKLNIIDNDGCSVNADRKLKMLLDQQDCKNGIVIANTEQWSDFFKRHPECFEDIQRHSLVMASTLNQFPRLEPIIERFGDIYISLMPFEDVGRAIATKINALLEGRFVDNTTLVNPVFEKYSDLLSTYNELCESEVGNNDESLLLTV